jgi:hypothetical protein
MTDRDADFSSIERHHQAGGGGVPKQFNDLMQHHSATP